MPKVCTAVLLLMLCACQTVEGAPVAAKVDLADPGTRALVVSALAKAVGRGHVELGPVASSETSVITLLPPKPGPYEGNSVAMPVSFHFKNMNGKCVAVRDDTGAVYELPGVHCS